MPKILLEQLSFIENDELICEIIVRNGFQSPWLVKNAKKLGLHDKDNQGEHFSHICHSQVEHKAKWVSIGCYTDHNNIWVEPIYVSVRCPKCRSNTIELHEVITGESIWQVHDGVIIGSGDTQPCDPQKVFGECLKCQHCWTVRKATMIEDCYAENQTGE